MAIFRKSVELELDEKTHSSDGEKPDKVADTDEQVANRMQRLNLYFEKENVSADQIWKFAP